MAEGRTEPEVLGPPAPPTPELGVAEFEKALATHPETFVGLAPNYFSRCYPEVVDAKCETLSGPAAKDCLEKRRDLKTLIADFYTTQARLQQGARFMLDSIAGMNRILPEEIKDPLSGTLGPMDVDHSGAAALTGVTEYAAKIRAAKDCAQDRNKKNYLFDNVRDPDQLRRECTNIVTGTPSNPSDSFFRKYVLKDKNLSPEAFEKFKEQFKISELDRTMCKSFFATQGMREARINYLDPNGDFRSFMESIGNAPRIAEERHGRGSPEAKQAAHDSFKAWSLCSDSKDLPNVNPLWSDAETRKNQPSLPNTYPPKRFKTCLKRDDLFNLSEVVSNYSGSRDVMSQVGGPPLGTFIGSGSAESTARLTPSLVPLREASNRATKRSRTDFGTRRRST